MNGFPITKYSLWQIKKGLKIFIILLISIFLIGNILTASLTKRINVNPDSYTIKEGFPMFNSGDDYLNLIKLYPYDFGTGIKIHKMKREESYWDVSRRHRISLDTLIAANPFLDTLQSKEGIEIVIPQEDGVLFAFDNLLDLWSMSNLLGYEDAIMGDYLQSIFKLFSLDEIRFAFFKKAKPEIVNCSLAKLYSLRKIFQSPIRGRYTSMFGVRVDPFLHGKTFHNGIDIKGITGDPIYAAREGIVSFTGWRKYLGNCVIVQHRDGYETTYGHCSTIKVKKGNWVTKKDIIGLIGSTGRSTGSHLHFTIKRHGKLINPIIFIW